VLRGGGVSGGGVVVVVVRCVVWCVLGVPWVCGGCVVCEVSGGGVAGFIVVGGGGRRRRRGRVVVYICCRETREHSPGSPGKPGSTLEPPKVWTSCWPLSDPKSGQNDVQILGGFRGGVHLLQGARGAQGTLWNRCIDSNLLYQMYYLLEAKQR
jgi:hypothetical protein